MLSHKKLFVALTLTSVVVFITATAMKSPQVLQQQDEGFKNLKVLPKDISKDDLEKVMHSWNDALGVRCNFCHARNAETNKMEMASDAKPEKLMAREMMKMTEDINKKYFKDKDKEHKEDMLAAVTCITCHHGAAHPSSTAAAKPAGFGPPQGGFGPPAGQQTPPPVKQ